MNISELIKNKLEYENIYFAFTVYINDNMIQFVAFKPTVCSFLLLLDLKYLHQRIGGILNSLNKYS